MNRPVYFGVEKSKVKFGLKILLLKGYEIRYQRLLFDVSEVPDYSLIPIAAFNLGTNFWITRSWVAGILL